MGPYLYKHRIYDSETKNIGYQLIYHHNSDRRDEFFSYYMPSEVNASEYEDADFYGKFDYKGDVINMEIKRQKVKNK